MMSPDCELAMSNSSCISKCSEVKALNCNKYIIRKCIFDSFPLALECLQQCVSSLDFSVSAVSN